MAKKLTKREQFEALLAKYDFTEAEKEFINHEIDLLVKKNSTGGERKPTATQKENVGIKASILEVLENGALTVTEITKALDGDYTNQKVSALVRQLVAEGSVTRFEEKRKAYFKLA